MTARSPIFAGIFLLALAVLRHYGFLSNGWIFAWFCLLGSVWLLQEITR